MKFCPNCGKELGDEAVFCTGCGAGIGNAASSNPPASTSGAYDASNTAGAPVQNGSYQQGGAPQGQPYYQNAPQGQPYYQNTPYPGGPAYPGGPGGGKKTLPIIIAVVAAVVVIGGVITAFLLLSNKNNTSLSGGPGTSANVRPPADTATPVVTDMSIPQALADFDTDTADNILAAFEEIGLDANAISNFDTYSEADVGTVYTFTYKGSVVDLLVYSDGSVYSIETKGTQVYLEGYESYSISSYLGGTTHYDESYPDSGYVFYKDEQDIDGALLVTTKPGNDYAVEIISSDGQTLISAFYMQGGETEYLMGLPTGTYEIRYAAGPTWYNTDELFGDDTVYFVLDKQVTVTQSEGNPIVLDAAGGGTSASPITYDEF
ncbi:zinc ribbon domain-containing protein [Oscillospiraceae bacterium WX1]